MMRRCYQIDESDNVATMLEDGSEGPVTVLGAAAGKMISLMEPLPLGHKLALAAIEPGASIVKYGVTIGIATQRIMPGQRVHLHNCRSAMDERSSTLDVETGATTDTAYE